VKCSNFALFTQPNRNSSVLKGLLDKCEDFDTHRWCPYSLQSGALADPRSVAIVIKTGTYAAPAGFGKVFAITTMP
jgi:hypothetical protein